MINKSLWILKCKDPSTRLYIAARLEGLNPSKRIPFVFSPLGSVRADGDHRALPRLSVINGNGSPHLEAQAKYRPSALAFIFGMSLNGGGGPPQAPRTALVISGDLPLPTPLRICRGSLSVRNRPSY